MRLRFVIYESGSFAIFFYDNSYNIVDWCGTYYSNTNQLSCSLGNLSIQLMILKNLNDMDVYPLNNIIGKHA